MQGVISTEAEAHKCCSSLLEAMHRRLVGLVNAAPDVSAGDHKAKDLHVAPTVNEMLEKYTDEVTSLLQCLQNTSKTFPASQHCAVGYFFVTPFFDTCNLTHVAQVQQAYATYMQHTSNTQIGHMLHTSSTNQDICMLTCICTQAD